MKRYLSGIDWVMHSLDYAGRKACGIGNISQVVLELEGSLEETRIRERLNLLEKIPLIHGSPSRGLNLCPYWKVDLRNYPFTLNTFSIPNNLKIDELLRIFGNGMNKPFRNKREHLVFNLIKNNQKSFLGMVFDHRLLAARGAETLLSILGSQTNLTFANEFSAPTQLNNWLDKFKAGRKVNRFFMYLNEGKIRSFSYPKKNRKSNFSFVAFDMEESAKISEDSLKQAGYLMNMPYLLAKSIIILHRVFEKREAPRSDYLIPVSIDKRPQGLAKDKVFFNHLSFFFFRIKHEETKDLKKLLSAIKEQMYEQVKEGLPEAICQASLLMRIVPPYLVNLFTRFICRSKVTSFSFSIIVDNPSNSVNFLGNKILNIFHLPRVPYPPGIGVFFNQFQGKINATFSYLEGLLNDDEINQITEDLKSLA